MVESGLFLRRNCSSGTQAQVNSPFKVPSPTGLIRLATSIPGLSPVGAAAILARTGNPRRFATLVEHAGSRTPEKTSGAFTGRTRLTGQGRPGPRLAGRAVSAGPLVGKSFFPGGRRQVRATI